MVIIELETELCEIVLITTENMAQRSSNVTDDVDAETDSSHSGMDDTHQGIEMDEGERGNPELQHDQFWKIFESSKSYWDSYIRTSAWLNQHCNVLQEAQRTGSRYEQWCRSQMSYHAFMADFFYSQWLTSQSSSSKKHMMGDVSDGSKLEMPLQSSSDGGRCAYTPRHESKRRNRTRKSSKRSRSRRNKRKSLGHSSCHIELHLGDDDDPVGSQLGIFFDGAESTEFEMEITEDMLQFFTQSAKHREERDSKKPGRNIPGHDIYVELTEVNTGKNKATTEPPKERPGHRRIEEMKELYGNGAAMIHGMETAMQLTFDRNSDRKQPHPWPALPINFNTNDTRNVGVFLKAKAS